MSIEFIATVIVAAFLGWAWLVARRAADDCNRRAAERRAHPERWATPSSWEGSAEQQMHSTVSGTNQSQPPY